MITTHNYSFKNIKGDYFRSLLGVFLCLCPYLLGGKMEGATLFFTGCSVLFVIYGIRTFIRQMIKVVLNENSLKVVIYRDSTLTWDDISQLSLSFFSLRRDGNEGWMQLCVKGAGKTMRFESSLSDFDVVVRRAIQVAVTNKITLSQSTLSNVEALNINLVDIGYRV